VDWQQQKKNLGAFLTLLFSFFDACLRTNKSFLDGGRLNVQLSADFTVYHLTKPTNPICIVEVSHESLIFFAMQNDSVLLALVF
jgi:hypothetical protein